MLLGLLGVLALHMKREREIVMKRRAKLRSFLRWYEPERGAEPYLGTRGMSSAEGMEPELGEGGCLFHGILDHDRGVDSGFQECEPGCRLAKGKDRRSDGAQRAAVSATRFVTDER